MNCLPKNFLKNILLIPLFITNLSFGQKPVFGIKAGLALANATIKPANPDPYNPYYTTSTKVGALAGIYLDIFSGNKIIFRPGAEVVSKGTGGGNNFIFVDFPLNILYKIKYTTGYFIAGGGPSIGVPINDYYHLYPLKTEFGVNGLIGYQLAIGFSFNLNYSYGLSNANKSNQFISKISNRYLGITLGYSF